MAITFSGGTTLSFEERQRQESFIIVHCLLDFSGMFEKNIVNVWPCVRYNLAIVDARTALGGVTMASE